MDWTKSQRWAYSIAKVSKWSCGSYNKNKMCEWIGRLPDRVSSDIILDPSVPGPHTLLAPIPYPAVTAPDLSNQQQPIMQNAKRQAVVH